MALVDLAEDDQGDGQVVELAEPAVQLDGRLGRAHALLLAAVGEGAVGHGEVGVQARLKAQVADLPRDREPPLARLDGAARVEGTPSPSPPNPASERPNPVIGRHYRLGVV